MKRTEHGAKAVSNATQSAEKTTISDQEEEETILPFDKDEPSSPRRIWA
jgi:hypothetical protein